MKIGLNRYGDIYIDKGEGAALPIGKLMVVPKVNGFYDYDAGAFRTETTDEQRFLIDPSPGYRFNAETLRAVAQFLDDYENGLVTAVE